MKAFLAIKYYEDMRNKDLIEKICMAFKKQGIDIFVFARDVQHYKSCDLSPQEIMKRAFREIKSSDIFIIDASELSIGIGVEAGVAYSSSIPVYLIAQKDAEVSNSIKGISKKSCFYTSPEDLARWKI
jgi:nucleoside 2-deoxyribosyltransferase